MGGGGGEGGRARSDWRLSDLSNWAEGREGQGRTITTGKRRERKTCLVISAEEPPLSSAAKPP